MTAIPSIVHLDKKLSARVDAGRGVGLTADELALLVSLGLIDILHGAKTTYLKEQARCRDAKLRSIDGGDTGSRTTAKLTGSSAAPSSPSSGTTPTPDEQRALQRGQRKSKRQ